MAAARKKTAKPGGGARFAKIAKSGMPPALVAAIAARKKQA